MSDALTTLEVQRHAKSALQALHGAPLEVGASPALRNAIERAVGSLNELLLLVDLVEAVETGLAVIVERDEAPA